MTPEPLSKGVVAAPLRATCMSPAVVKDHAPTKHRMLATRMSAKPQILTAMPAANNAEPIMDNQLCFARVATSAGVLLTRTRRVLDVVVICAALVREARAILCARDRRLKVLEKGDLLLYRGEQQSGEVAAQTEPHDYSLNDE